MTTSASAPALAEPHAADLVPPSTFAYFRARNRHRLYTIVMREFKKSGITQADLARRLGKGTDVVCRLLGAPGNWQIDTASDLLFAISGAEVEYNVGYPLARPPRNFKRPDWVDKGITHSKSSEGNLFIFKMSPAPGGSSP